eukprot:3594610-Rhodomonas_salina.2
MVSLRACYAKPGTERAYGATSSRQTTVTTTYLGCTEKGRIRTCLTTLATNRNQKGCLGCVTCAAMKESWCASCSRWIWSWMIVEHCSCDRTSFAVQKGARVALVLVGLHLRFGIVEVYDSMRMQTAQSTLSTALRREYQEANLPTPHLLFLDGPAQVQGLDCFGFAVLALCCRKHDRLIRFDTTEALRYRDWVALLLVKTGAPGVLTPTTGQHLALPLRSSTGTRRCRAS